MFPVKRFLNLITLLAMLSSACSHTPTTPPPIDPSPTSLQLKNDTYIVQPGDTLYSIARQFGTNVNDLARWNQLFSPYLLQPGQRLLLTQPSTTQPSCPDCKQVYRENRPSPTPTTTPTASCYPPVSWQWPTSALQAIPVHLITTGQSGLNIIGRRRSQPIYAAATGTVIYSEQLINGYRNLIIIQHNQAFSSLYANNAQRRVAAGQRVVAGQFIADLGTDSNNQPLLYFEIRCGNKTLAPLEYLPH